MTRRSRRELERAVRELTPDDAVAGDRCPKCGGLPTGTDAREGITAEFATLECTCDVDLPDGCEMRALGTCGLGGA